MRPAVYPLHCKMENNKRCIKTSNSSVVGSFVHPSWWGGIEVGAPVPGPSSVSPRRAAAPPLAPFSPFSLPHVAGRGSPNKGEHMCVVIPILAHVFTIHGVPRRPRRVPAMVVGGFGVGGEGHDKELAAR